VISWKLMQVALRPVSMGEAPQGAEHEDPGDQ